MGSFFLPIYLFDSTRCPSKVLRPFFAADLEANKMRESRRNYCRCAFSLQSDSSLKLADFLPASQVETCSQLIDYLIGSLSSLAPTKTKLSCEGSDQPKQTATMSAKEWAPLRHAWRALAHSTVGCSKLWVLVARLLALPAPLNEEGGAGKGETSEAFSSLRQCRQRFVLVFG